jgi:hypothetical protein
VVAIGAAIFSSDQKSKQALEDAQAAWAKMTDQVNAFNLAAKGFTLGPLTNELQSLNTQVASLQQAAIKANDWNSARQLADEFNQAVVRITGEFEAGAQTLTPYQTALKALNDEAAGLISTLQQEGFYATAAGIAPSLAAQIKALTDQYSTSFVASLQARLNTANGLDYLNTTTTLINQHAQDIADANTYGQSLTLVDQVFKAEAQKIVNDAGLSGDALAAFTKQFPELAGVVTDATTAIAAAVTRTAADIASTQQSFQDQLFNLQQDSTTLAGQLAVFDRQAAEDRAAEAAKGDQALVDLEALQAAERLAIITNFNNQAATAAAQAAATAQQAAQQAAATFQTFMTNLSTTIQTFLDGLSGGANSVLSPQARLAAAQSQYNSQLGLAQGGDQTAAGNITQYAQSLIDAAKAYYASSSGTQNIVSQITAQLGALPAQISATQQIVNAITSGDTNLIAALQGGNATAIASALLPDFNQLTANTNGLLSFSEFQAIAGNLADTATLQKIFNSIDSNGNGQISLLELINAAGGSTSTNTGSTNKSIQDMDKNISDTVSYQAGLQEQMVAKLNAIYVIDAATQNQNFVAYLGLLPNTNNILSEILNTLAQAGGTNNLLTRILEDLAVENQNWGRSSTIAGVGLPTFATGTDFAPGGLALVGERGPEIVNLPRGSQVIPNHRIANDNGGMAALQAEVRALRADLAAVGQRIVQASVLGTQELAAPLVEVAKNTKTSSKAARRSA